ncbi:MAG: ankyrin repeat domain-containing protein [Acidobacteria bacterium]|nr:ankyrin repeat domain-containing protein [Acidobacteriota bacterium]
MSLRSLLRFGTRATVAALLSGVLAAAPAAPVAEAARSGDLATIKRLLKEGADVNAALGDGTTALHHAALRGDAEAISVLLYAGANLRATTRLGGYTALHLASQRGHDAAVEALLKGGANPNQATQTGATPLMLASASGHVAAVKLLLANKAEVDARESANEQTALMFAAAYDRPEVVKVLLEVGADVKLTSKLTDLTDLVSPEEALQDEIRQATQRASTNAGGRSAAPTLTAPPAADRPANDVAGVTRGYRYNELIGKQGGLSPLHFAIRQGSLASVKTMIENRADVNQRVLADGTPALVLAIINGHYDMAMYLLENGADPNASGENGNAPLYATLNLEWAPKSFYPQPRAQLQQKTTYMQLLTALLDKGADPNARLRKKVWHTQYNFDLLRTDEIGATPFWKAAYAADIEAMKLLIARGADPNVTTMKPVGAGRRGEGTQAGDPSGLQTMPAGSPGIGPLQAAAGVGYGEGFAGNAHRFAATGMLAAVKYLIEEVGLDVNGVDDDGNTAVHHAASRGDNEMIQYLVSKGADVTRVNRSGLTTVDMANGPVQRTQPYPETIKLLEGLGAKNNNRCVSC